MILTRSTSPSENQLERWHRGSSHGPLMPYNKFIDREIPHMQVTSKRHSMVVEFRPHNILTDKFVYTLKFRGDAQSMRLMSKKEMIETVNARLDLHGYTVTDFLTEPQAYFPASC